MLKNVDEWRISIWKSVINAWLEGFPIGGGHWHVLTVNDGRGKAVASRRFAKEAEAERARERFVQAVAAMSDDIYERADWQSVLDAV